MVLLGQTVRRAGLFGLSVLGVVNSRVQPRAEDAPSELTDCHVVGTELHCIADSKEWLVHIEDLSSTDIPSSVTSCHAHGEDLFCVLPSGGDVLVTPLEEAGHDEHGDEDHEDHEEPMEEEDPQKDGASSGQNCHFHAGVEHCTGGNSEEVARTCSRVDRDYNITLRIGLIFAMLATSTLGVYLPIFATSFVCPTNIAFTILRQFGTGIIISTAFVHLFVHAMLMFQNECLEGRVEYESTAAAILMAGLFLSFLIEYAGVRLIQWHRAKEPAKSVEDSSDGCLPGGRRIGASLNSEMINIYVLEAGIIFHSFLIGLTLVVSGDAFFITLYIVITFHQFFEGVALGSRIAALGLSPAATLGLPAVGHGHAHHDAQVEVLQKPASSTALESQQSQSQSDTEGEVAERSRVSLGKKVILAAMFALVTPAGMALGTGILSHFNGNNPATLIAIGTLDAFSAGILVWVGVVEMWAHDWMMGGEMTRAGPLRTVLGLAGLMLGMALMSLLGKWA